MKNCCRFRMLVLLAGTLIFPILLPAQVFTGEKTQHVSPGLSKRLKTWETYKLDPASVFEYMQTHVQAPEPTFLLGDHAWQTQLQPSRMFSAQYSVQVLTPHGLEVHKPVAQKAFGGITNGGERVSLTVNVDYLSGFVYENGEAWYIEPLWYYQPTAGRDEFVVYPTSAVIWDQDATCMAIETDETMQQYEDEAAHDDHEGAEQLACYEIEIAIASDKSMFNKYGSVSAVEDHNITVLNNVQNNYASGWFNHDINFVVVTQFVVTGTDPWTNSTDAGTLLGSFRNWGNGGGFGVAFDQGELWTNRDFNGGTVGIAYLNAICNSNKYHCLQDYTNNSEQLRVLVAHEMGHNWSATHDNSGCPPNFIMCPFVTTSDDWSSQSQSQISSYITSRINLGNCLELCGSNPPLVADFDWAPQPGCVGQPVSFTDLSSGIITSRSWTFQSGSPGSSTQSNPSITWNTGGTFDVTLTVFGVGGSNAITKQVVIEPLPVANFTASVDELTVTFTNTSTNATSYTWDFGDGNLSTEVNPVHTYGVAGTYLVTLVVENDCGPSVKTLLVNTAPQAAFVADPTDGCASLTVQFENQSSSNSTSYVWQFPGGAPVSSSQPNPVVVYANSGVYTVTLTAFNSSGSNTFTQTNYITVRNIPSSNFNFTVNGLTVSFTNGSNGATSYLWNFGDGNTSTEANPVHTYAVGGSYTVTLTAINDCGSTVKTSVVGLIPPPTAQFSADQTAGCADLVVTFTDQSTGSPDSLSWFFPGGAPASSSAAQPVVTYSTAGTYNVTLIAINAGGSDTLTLTNHISVSDVPVSNFSSGVNGNTVSFTNGSTGAISYSWSFGDGGTSTESDPVHVYGAPGDYTVVLIATNACGSDTFTQQVSVVLPPQAQFSASPTSGCADLSVQFTNTSGNNPTSFYWEFPGGSPATSTLENPLVQYFIPGTYTVTLVASNSAGSDTLTFTNYIQVTTVPVAGFSNIINGPNVLFNNASSNATSYSWNFGDGGSSSQTNPVHTYAQDGTYTVMLIATNACGPDTFTQTVTIITAPQAQFSASPTTGCAELTVQFTNLSSNNATTFAWSFPGGSPDASTLENPVVLYSAPGSYSVTLIASNSAGSDTLTFTNYVTATTIPVAGFSSSTNGATASFTNGSTGATGYAWDFGDGNSSTETNPAHTYGMDGTYTVQLIATNACGPDTFTQVLTIITPPAAGFTVPVQEGCAPLTITFTNTSSENATDFLWDFPGGDPLSSTEEHPTVTWNTPGVYTVTLTASNSAGSSSSTMTITVLDGPTADFEEQLAGLGVVLTNMSVNAESYFWDFGDGGTSTETNPTHTYAEPGSYLITLTASNDCGTATYSTSIEILGSAPIAGFAAESTEGCAPFTVQFMDMSAGDPTSWKWSFPGGTPENSTDQNPVVVYPAAGTYNVTLEVTNAWGTDDQTILGYITVGTVPSATFTFSVDMGTVTFTNQSQNADLYLWNFGDGTISQETNPVHTYESSGTYTVELSAINECGASTLQQMVTVMVTGIDALDGLEQFSLFPNPNQGSFTVQLRGAARNELEFLLYDASGRLIERSVSDFGSGQLEKQFDHPELAAGIYTLNIRSNGQQMSVKVVVQ